MPFQAVWVAQQRLETDLALSDSGLGARIQQNLRLELRLVSRGSEDQKQWTHPVALQISEDDTGG